MSAPDRQDEPQDYNQDDKGLVDAYNRMMARIRDSIDTAEAEAVPTLQRAIDQAKKQAIHLGEITLEEAEEIGNYIKRDINDAAEYLMETSHEFSEWLMLDIDIIEQKVLELFLSVADKTRVELEQLSHPKCDITEYHTGEITGPGSLVCIKCKQMVHFNTTSQIPPCPNCKHTDFKRLDK
ncbi:MAG: zinc ribbon-containing protein [Gammaproteobacteria bacterium]|nr:zinc ribbon-containing protein [Gammaproteobacteria bacterium]